MWATEASVRPTSEHERKKLRRIGAAPVVVMLTLEDGETIEFAARPEHEAHLLGPFASTVESSLVAAPT